MSLLTIEEISGTPIENAIIVYNDSLYQIKHGYRHQSRIYIIHADEINGDRQITKRIIPLNSLASPKDILKFRENSIQ